MSIDSIGKKVGATWLALDSLGNLMTRLTETVSATRRGLDSLKHEIVQARAVFAPFPAARYEATNSAAIAARGSLHVNFDRRVYDTDSLVQVGNDAWQFTAKESGIYNVAVSVAVGIPTGIRAWLMLMSFHAGGETSSQLALVAAPKDWAAQPVAAPDLFLSAHDRFYVQLNVGEASGTTVASSAYNWIAVHMVRRCESVTRCRQ